MGKVLLPIMCAVGVVYGVATFCMILESIESYKESIKK